MYDHILVPIAFDGERDTSGPVKLAEKLLAPGGKITFLHVIERIPAYALSYLPEGYMTEARSAIEVELREIASKQPNSEALIIDGHSGRSILDWAKKNDPDLIILASHRPGMQDLLLGSTASQVVRHAQCAVHVMR